MESPASDTPPGADRDAGEHIVERIVSGGQTGVDRAALDWALANGVPAGGWCPRGRRAEDGSIDPRYPLDETPSDRYEQRTRWNVRDADGTLILNGDGPLKGGTRKTAEVASELGRPCLVISPWSRESARDARRWILAARVRTLNVAGPRASKEPEIYDAALRFLDRALRGENS